MHIFLFPTIPSDHQPHRQNTNHGFSCKRSRNTYRHCNRAIWHAAIFVVVDCMALMFNFHDCGCRGTTALQLNGTNSPLGCRAVTLWQPQNRQLILNQTKQSRIPYCLRLFYVPSSDRHFASHKRKICHTPLVSIQKPLSTIRSFQTLSFPIHNNLIH